jgi:TonB family protein
MTQNPESGSACYSARHPALEGGVGRALSEVEEGRFRCTLRLLRVLCQAIRRRVAGYDRKLTQCRNVSALVLVVILIVFLAALGSKNRLMFAQQAQQAPSRALVRKVMPIYPDVARRMNLTGKVRLLVVIAPDGHVKTARPIGGHPVLVQSAEDAIKNWKFAANSAESTQIVEVQFAGVEVR